MGKDFWNRLNPWGSDTAEDEEGEVGSAETFATLGTGGVPSIRKGVREKIDNNTPPASGNPLLERRQQMKRTQSGAKITGIRKIAEDTMRPLVAARIPHAQTVEHFIELAGYAKIDGRMPEVSTKRFYDRWQKAQQDSSLNESPYFDVLVEQIADYLLSKEYIYNGGEREWKISGTPEEVKAMLRTPEPLLKIKNTVTDQETEIILFEIFLGL